MVKKFVNHFIPIIIIGILVLASKALLQKYTGINKDTILLIVVPTAVAIGVYILKSLEAEDTTFKKLLYSFASAIIMLILIKYF